VKKVDTLGAVGYKSHEMPTINLNDVCVSDKPTHIVIYKEDGEYTLVPKKLLDELYELRERVKELTVKTRPSPFFGAELAPEPDGLEVERAAADVKETFNTIITKLEAPAAAVAKPAAAEVKIVKIAAAAAAPAAALEPEEAEETEEVEEEVEEGEGEGGEEGEEEGEEESEEGEEEALELKGFEYKGATYYRDTESQEVYQLDTDGDIDDTPIGVWNEAKQKILKYKV